MSEAGSPPSLTLRSFIVTSELTIAGIIGLLLLVLGADGSAWILGGIAAGAIVVLLEKSCFQRSFMPNRTARQVGQLLVGLMVGFSVQRSDIFALAAQAPLFILLTLCLVFSGIVAAFVYARLEKTDLLTALLATTPGNIGVMASIAADYGRNPALVSLVQLMRFTAVTSVIPLLTQVSQKPNILDLFRTLTTQLTDLRLHSLLELSLVLFLATLSIRVGTLLKIPVPALLCPLLVGISFNTVFTTISFLPSVDFNPPMLLNLLGQILLGITIGEYWGMNPAFGKATIVRGTLPVIVMMASGFLTAWLAKVITGWNWVTCLLVAAPGGSPEMIWIAIALNQSIEVVTTAHLVRLITLNALLPLMLVWSTSLQTNLITPTKNVAT